MDGILGKKIGMTQLISEDGSVTPVTVIEAKAATVVDVRTKARDGYEAVVAGFDDCKEKHLTKPQRGKFQKAGLPLKRQLKEFKFDGDAPQIGTTFNVSIFDGVNKVSVVGITKGHGFSGTVKRYGFNRGPETHGSKNIREPGSTGSNSYPSRVFPGKKMPGQYGNKRMTVKNLKLVKLDVEKNLIFVKGAVPGPNNGTVVVRKA